MTVEIFYLGLLSNGPKTLKNYNEIYFDLEFDVQNYKLNSATKTNKTDMSDF